MDTKLPHTTGIASTSMTPNPNLALTGPVPPSQDFSSMAYAPDSNTQGANVDLALHRAETINPSLLVPTPLGTVPVKTSIKLYRSSLQSCNYIFKDGSIAVFVSGKYFTDILSKQQELDYEIAVRHPNITHASADDLRDFDPDPMTNLKNKMRRELLAEMELNMAKANNPANNMGASDTQKLTPTSTRDIAAVTAGHGISGAASAAKLVDLAKNLHVPPVAPHK